MNNKTTVVNVNKVKTSWHVFDADDQILGRLSTEIAKILMGKNKAEFSPNLDLGDHVVVINAEKILVTGKKETDKIYYRHSGYPGALKSEVLGKLRDRRPTEILRRSIYGMLPKNKLRDVRMNKLHIYAGAEHPHTANIKK